VSGVVVAMVHGLDMSRRARLSGLYNRLSQPAGARAMSDEPCMVQCTCTTAEFNTDAVRAAACRLRTTHSQSLIAQRTYTHDPFLIYGNTPTSQYMWIGIRV
jgi:hypothetical protein